MPTIIPILAFTDNYMWLLREGAHAAVVDPGDAAPVIAYLDRENLTLSPIIATHHHNDHVGGIPELLFARETGGTSGEPQIGRGHEDPPAT